MSPPSVVCVCVTRLYPINECLICDPALYLTSCSTLCSSLLTMACSHIGPNLHVGLCQSTGLLSKLRQKRRAYALLWRHLDFTCGPQLLCRLHSLRLPCFRPRRHPFQRGILLLRFRACRILRCRRNSYPPTDRLKLRYTAERVTLSGQ